MCISFIYNKKSYPGHILSRIIQFSDVNVRQFLKRVSRARSEDSRRNHEIDRNPLRRRFFRDTTRSARFSRDFNRECANP